MVKTYRVIFEGGKIKSIDGVLPEKFEGLITILVEIEKKGENPFRKVANKWNKEEVQKIKNAIEEECERIDAHEW